MKFIAQKLNIKQTEDWYQVTTQSFLSSGGGGLLRRYNSVYESLINLIPEYDWKMWKFTYLTKNDWKGRRNIQRNFFDDLFKHKRYEKWTDWYQITKEDIVGYGGAALLKLHDGSYQHAVRISARDL